MPDIARCILRLNPHSGTDTLCSVGDDECIYGISDEAKNIVIIYCEKILIDTLDVLHSVTLARDGHICTRNEVVKIDTGNNTYSIVGRRIALYGPSTF